MLRYEMKNTIKNLYMDYKIYILDIENSKDLYKSILLYSYNNFKNIDTTEINISLKSMLETFHEILDSQDSVTTLISNNELISFYFLIIALIINQLSDRIGDLFDLLNRKKILSEIQDVENIFLFTDHLLKNIQYIFECIELEFIGEYESK